MMMEKKRNDKLIGAAAAATTTALEMTWARRIKQAAERDEAINVDKITDLEFLQHALVAKDKIPQALMRIKRMQDFKKKYGIQLDGSIEEAMRDLKAFHAAHDGLYLSVGNLPDGTGVLCADYSQVNARDLACDESYAIRMRGIFYYLQATHCNIKAMRAGFCSLVDQQHTSWRNIHMRAQERIGELMSKAYPMRVQQIVMLNANRLAVFCYHVMKYFFSTKVRQRIVVNTNMKDFLTANPNFTPVLPRVWGGKVDSNPQALTETILDKLRERYALAATFQLCEGQ